LGLFLLSSFSSSLVRTVSLVACASPGRLAVCWMIRYPAEPRTLTAPLTSSFHSQLLLASLVPPLLVGSIDSDSVVLVAFLMRRGSSPLPTLDTY
jgi:hypothetical protein